VIFKYILNKLSTLKIIIFYCFIFSLCADSKVSSKEFSLGSTKAENILVEYASLSCVHCANFHNEVLPKIKTKFIDTGKLRYIYKDFPLDKPAMFAAMIAHCYSDNQYFEVLSSLYRNQKAWVTASDNTEKFYDAIHGILKIHGISLQKINQCVDDKNKTNQKTWDDILAARLEGQNIGVKSTPSFFLNGKRIEEAISIELLEKLIQ
tara:strand:- start:937 stop:1557 length:621 start_codon:yes stop_codon:yes gene_type:complete